MPDYLIRKNILTYIRRSLGFDIVTIPPNCFQVLFSGGLKLNGYVYLKIIIIEGKPFCSAVVAFGNHSNI